MNRERQYSLHKAVTLSELKLPDELSELSVAQCNCLCGEIRNLLIRTVLETGGHLASNLGVVELTLALHRNFHSPEDKIVWDVGHQAYVHKILTGRADQLRTLRQENGLAGFPKPSESIHDTFITGHSSTALSAAFGMAEAMRLSGQGNHYAVAVVGDGAMTGGLFYEGLNNAGKTKANLIVILNDNNQAISKNVGAIAKYLSKIRRKTDYVRTKWTVERVIGKAPAIGTKLASSLKSTKDRLRKSIIQTTIFEDMGFVYLGPVDGHDIEALDETLKVAKVYQRPVVVHVQTVKGKGYAPAEKNPGEYHGVPRHDIPQNEIARVDLDSRDPELSIDECFSTVFGKALTEFAATDKQICAVTAAMKYGTGLQFFAAEHPNRFYDVGIAEQHATTFCAALAAMGKTPVFAVYSTFLQRAFDQLLHDTAIAGLHLVLGVDRAGFVGEDGETHQGIFDIPMLSAIPNCKIYSPASYEELRLCLQSALYKDKAIAAVRYPRGQAPSDFPIAPDINYTHLSGKGTLIITYGRISEQAYHAMQQLRAEGIPCGLLKLTTVFPIAEEILSIAAQYERICFFEESSRAGGIGEKLAAALFAHEYPVRFRCYAVDGFVQQASAERSLAKYGFTADAMAQRVREIQA